MPGRFSRKLGKVAVLVDTSGSTQPYLAAFGAALDDILSEFDCEAVVAYHDVPVQKVSEWEPGDEPFELENIGGGGTSHVPVFDWLAKLTDEPTCVVAFTDGFTTLPDRFPEIPLLWAIAGNDSFLAPSGSMVRIEL
jgi:predicted metal-dependent peptidase